MKPIWQPFNGRVKPYNAFTAEDESFFNGSGGMYGISMGMYGADGFTNFIGGIVPAIIATKKIRQRRATQYATDLESNLQSQNPESTIPQVMQSSIANLKNELANQKNLRSRAKKRGDKMKYDEGVQVVQDLLNYYEGKATAQSASPMPAISTIPESPAYPKYPTGLLPSPSMDPLTGQPSAPSLPVEKGDGIIGSAVVAPTVSPSLQQGSATPEDAPPATIKKGMNPWILAGGAAVLLTGAFFMLRKKK